MLCRTNEWRALSVQLCCTNEWRTISARHVHTNEWRAIGARHVVVEVTAQLARFRVDTRVDKGLRGRWRNKEVMWTDIYTAHTMYPYFHAMKPPTLTQIKTTQIFCIVHTYLCTYFILWVSPPPTPSPHIRAHKNPAPDWSKKIQTHFIVRTYVRT